SRQNTCRPWPGRARCTGNRREPEAASLAVPARRRFPEEKEGNDTPSKAQNWAGLSPEEAKRFKRPAQAWRLALGPRGAASRSVEGMTVSDMRHLLRIGRPLQGTQHVNYVIRRALTNCPSSRSRPRSWRRRWTCGYTFWGTARGWTRSPCRRRWPR